MRSALAGGAFILALVSLAGAQPLPATVLNRLSPKDAVIVITKNAGEMRGALVSASASSLVISVKGRREEIPAADIASIDKPGDPVWGGAIVGGVGLGLAFMGGAGASCSPNCDKEVPAAAAGGAAIGAAIGAGIDYLHRGRTRLYRAPLPPRVDRPAAAGPAAASEPPHQGTASLGRLWEQVKPGDPVSLDTVDGRRLEGRFNRASDAVLAVATDTGVQEFPATDVRRLARKSGGTHGRRGVLIGVPLGALFGSGACYRLDTFMHPADSGMSCGAAVAIGAAAGGAVGFTVGRTVWRRTVVYEAPDTTAFGGADARRVTDPKRVDVAVAPMLSRHRIGVAGTVTFAGGR